MESDGRLAFINDTAYEVITRANPTRVDMVLVLVEPPPDLPIVAIRAARASQVW